MQEHTTQDDCVETTGSYNRLEPYIPIEFNIVDFERSWKKCKCGRIVLFRDNWCPACGQRIGFPQLDD